jgi:hypothetical protein
VLARVDNLGDASYQEVLARSAGVIEGVLTALAAVVASGDRTASVELGPSLKMRRRANRA